MTGFRRVENVRSLDELLSSHVVFLRQGCGKLEENSP